MAGHSKWSKVKHIKGPLDVKRGAILPLLVKGITFAARLGGGDLTGNIRPRAATDAAKAGNIPKDKIEQGAVEKDTKELEGEQSEKITYEGHAPSGVAVIVETAANNKNHRAAATRGVSTKHHASLATAGRVSYMFHKEGQSTVPRAAGVHENRLFELTLDAGVEDPTTDKDSFILTSTPDRFYAVNEASRAGGVAPGLQRLTFMPDTTVPITDEVTKAQILRLHGTLENHSDAQNIYPNFGVAHQLQG